jgi:hypothetical protein
MSGEMQVIKYLHREKNALGKTMSHAGTKPTPEKKKKKHGDAVGDAIGDVVGDCLE